VGRIEIHQLRPVSEHQFFELVDVGASNVPPDQPRAGAAKTAERAEIAWPIDDHRIAGIDQASRQQIEPLLGAGKNQDVVGTTAKPLGNCGAKARLSFGGAKSQGRGGVV